jgi:hypothetical protein
MNKKTVSLGTISTPERLPEAGLYESLMFLDQNGYIDDTPNYVTAMARAGLRCINPRTSNAPPIYAVHSHPDGLFNDGVSALGRDLLQILAYEGFEGEVRDVPESVVYILMGGNLLTHGYIENESFTINSMSMVA